MTRRWRRSAAARRWWRRLGRNFSLPSDGSVIVHDIGEFKHFIIARDSNRRWRTGVAFARIRIFGNDPSNGSENLFHCWFLLRRGRSHRFNDL
jgi:hypothetical protein